MNIIIREALRQDCARLMELIHELAVFERAPEQVTVTLEHFEESGFGATPVWWAFVAEVDGNVEGFALYYIRYSTWKGQRMYLEDLLVTEKMRAKGLGKLLFDKLIAEGKEKNFPEWFGRCSTGTNLLLTSTKSTRLILMQAGLTAALTLNSSLCATYVPYCSYVVKFFSPHRNSREHRLHIEENSTHSFNDH